jgi:hypothetical protein
MRADLPRPPDLALESYQAAEQWLQRAGEALGGAAKLRAIDRLRISTVERQSRPPIMPRDRTFKLWLPDRFQSETGLVTHTLNGGRLTIDRDVPPDVLRSAEEFIPATFRRVSLAFLLRAPGLAAPRVQGQATIAGGVSEFLCVRRD